MSIPATVVEYLDQAGVDYRVVEHPHSESSLRTAEVAHVSGEHVAKGVLLKDADGYVLAVLPATHSVMLSSVHDLLHRPLETAPEVDLQIVFADCEFGAVPALGVTEPQYPTSWVGQTIYPFRVWARRMTARSG